MLVSNSINKNITYHQTHWVPHAAGSQMKSTEKAIFTVWDDNNVSELLQDFSAIQGASSYPWD